MLENNEVSAVIHTVRVALSRAQREHARGPVIVELEPLGRYGIDAVRRDAELIVDRPSSSARPVVGSLIHFAKRVFRRLVRWYAKPVAVQQSIINQRMLEIDEKLARSVARVETAIGDATMRLDSLEGTVERLAADVAVGAGGAAAAESEDLLPSVQKLLAYARFEDRHRGPQEVVQPLLEPYLAAFDGCRRVLDLGCGRGEFIGMLLERGIPAYGIDSDASQVAVAREAGRDVRQEEAISHLHGLATGEIDGVFSSQVAEHLTTNQLLTIIDLVHKKLAPGGVLLMETPNPEALFIFSTFFYVDLTHIKPIHPEALRWAFEACGFDDVRIQRSQRVPDSARLAPVPDELRSQPGWDVLGRNTETLNNLIFGYQHYAAIGRKSKGAA